MSTDSDSPASEIAPDARRDVTVIALVGYAHGTSHFYHLLIPPLFPWLMRDFGLGFTEAGLMMTAFFVVSGAGQALAGFLVDRWGARRVLMAGMGLLALSGLLLSVAASFALLLLAAMVAGLGNSVFHPSDFTIINRRVSLARLGHAFSVHGLSGYLGWAAATVFMAGIAGIAGWRVAAFAAAGVALLSALVLHLQRRWIDDAVAAPRDPLADAGPPLRATAFLGSPLVWMCFAFFLSSTMAFGAIQNFSPQLFQHFYGVALALGASGLTAFLVGGAVGMVGGGFLASRGHPSEWLIALALTIAAAVALLLASGAPPAWAIVPLMALMGAGGGLAGPSRDMLVRRAATSGLGAAAFGRVYGFVYSGLDVGLACAPVVFGRLMDGGRFGEVLTGVAILQTLAIFTALKVGAGSRAAASAA